MNDTKPPELLPCEVCVRAQFRVVNMVAGGESCGVCGTVQLRIRACPSDKPSTRDEALTERTAQLIAHRVCCGTEHDPLNGKLHGYCVVCGVCWPCQYAGTPPSLPAPVYNLVNTTPSTGDGGSVNTPTPAQQER